MVYEAGEKNSNGLDGNGFLKAAHIRWKTKWREHLGALGTMGERALGLNLC